MNLIFTILVSLLSLSVVWLFLKNRSYKKQLEYGGTYYDDNDDEIEMDWVRRDKFGNDWYAYRNHMKVPAKRAIIAEVALNQSKMNVTKERLQEYLIMIEKNLNEGKAVKAVQILANLKDRVSWAGEEKTLLALAKCYFVIKGESLTAPSEKYDRIKQQVLEDDPDTRAFFLTKAMRLTTGFSDISESDTLTYLMTKNQQAEE